MRPIVIYPYKMSSASATALAALLDVKKVYPDRDFKPSPKHVVVNWGNGNHPLWDGNTFTFMNRPENVCHAINKIDAFYRFMDSGVKTPVWTQHREWAEKWIKNGEWACVRNHVEGMDGEGLVLAKKLSEMKDANLYTKYVPIAKEYRVYVFKDKIIDILEKRRKDKDEAHPHIRTETNGWVFCKGSYTITEEAKKNCVKAIKCLDLDFGGVDIIVGEKDGQCYVLEVNSAPGIGGETVIKFRDEILKFVESLGN